MPEPTSKLSAFLSELKRRRVFRVAIVYAGVAFVIFQIIDSTFDLFSIPDWLGRFLVIALVLGFPIAIGLAWAFDITDQGIVRTGVKQKVAANAKAPPRVLISNKALAVVALLAVLTAAWSWWGRPGSPMPDKSIAVLPFANLSDSKEDEYFSDGVTDDIITHLIKIGGLKVISRTSVMLYKDSPKTLRVIADELGVSNILEGTVRRAGDKVRITSQLIDVRTDAHLWAETYDRDLTDIFAIQSDVARQIAWALKAELSPTEKARIEKEPTRDIEAHNLYLKGLHFWNRFTEEGIDKSIEYFRQTIERDSNYALAHVGLADAYVLKGLGHGTGAMRSREAYSIAKQAVAKALEIDEELGEAHATLGFLSYIADFDWTKAEREFKRTIALNPSYAQGYTRYAMMLSALERYEEAIAVHKRAQGLDPLAPIITSDLAWTYLYAGRHDEAIGEAKKAIELDPNFPSAYAALGWAFVKKGNYQEGFAELQKAVALTPGGTNYLADLGMAYGMAGERKEAEKVIQQLRKWSEERYISPYHIAQVYAGLGEKDEAIRWLESAYEERAGWISTIKGGIEFQSLRSDPRFQALLRRMNFPE